MGALGLLTVLGSLAFVLSERRPAGPETTRLEIEAGDSIARLFAKAGLPDRDLLALMEADRGAAFGLVLVPGEEVRIDRREDGGLARIVLGNGDGEATAFVADEDRRFAVASVASVASVLPLAETPPVEPGAGMQPLT